MYGSGFAVRRIALTASLVLALAASFLLVGCGASESARPPATVTVTVEKATARGASTTAPQQPQPRRPPAPAEPPSLKTFSGSHSSVAYPATWDVEAAEVSEGRLPRHDDPQQREPPSDAEGRCCAGRGEARSRLLGTTTRTSATHATRLPPPRLPAHQLRGLRRAPLGVPSDRARNPASEG